MIDVKARLADEARAIGIKHMERVALSNPARVIASPALEPHSGDGRREACLLGLEPGKSILSFSR